ncbi:protein phosphatase 1 regulatory subunit 15A isoform X2 [Vombatus ursinus]|uniref:protein phosphatase 1 regulatory subunit 15A isoform X2 n=1 Tax=Vombatus ursinus TaxID=29139 RepID=UPI000FFD65AE|nr:protein phosphatase 1 regulatory subunit 15A isoform X2 [Vombatus ursinus]
MTHRLDPPSPALGHTTGVPVEASLRSSLFSGLLFLLAWALAQLWRVGLQPKPRGEAKLVSPEAGAEEEESTFVQAPGPWPEVRRAWASPSPLPWAKQVRKEGDEGTAEGPTGCGSGEQKVHEGAARREKPGGRPAGPAQQDDGQGAEGAARDLLMGQRALWPGEGMVDENEDAGEQAPGAAEQSPPSHVDGGPQGLWPLAWQLREEADKRGMGGAEESNSEGGVGRQPPVLTSPLLRAWAYRPGEDEDEDEEDVSDGEGGAGSPLLRAWAYRPGEDEDEDEVDVSDGEGGDEGEEDVSDGEGGAGSPLLRAWAYRPGEDEDEDEVDVSDGEGGDEDEEDVSDGEGGAGSPLLRAWAYRPGEDEDEDEVDVSDGEGDDEEGGDEDEEDVSDGEGDGEEGGDEDEEDVSDGEGGAGSPLLRAWAYRPGEDEDEDEVDVSDGEGGDEDEEDVSDGEGGAGSPLLRAWACQPEEENEDQEDAKGETVCNVGPGLQTFRVSIFVPGAERPPPWPSPQLPQRLKRRLPPRRPPVELKPESPPGRKVRFSSTVELHLLVVWAGPAHAARRGPWEQLARDRSRFMRRIAQVEVQLGPFLCPDARARAWARLQAQTISPELRKPSSPPAVVLSSFQDGPCHPPSHPPSPSQ